MTPLMSSEVETARCKTLGDATGFLDYALLHSE
jgi:hypothetical protein